MKAYGGMEIQLHTFVASMLDRVSDKHHALPTVEGSSGTQTGSGLAGKELNYCACGTYRQESLHLELVTTVTELF